MPENRYRILYVGGLSSALEAIRGVLKQAGGGSVCVLAEDLSALKDALARGTWDAAVVDTQAPEAPLAAVLSVLSKTAKNVPAIVVSDKSDEDSTARFLKAGATYILYRSDLNQLLPLLQKEREIPRSASGRPVNDPSLLRQAFYDGLTGLPTRALFSEQLLLMVEHAACHRQKFAVFFIDLDKFKFVNDTYGHAQGDWLLQSAAKRLSHIITDADILARLGGDEFLLVAPIASLEESAAIAQRLIKALESPFIINDLHVNVSASVGISIFPDHGDDPTVLMQRADQALYRAKHQGRNNYQFFSTAIDTLAKKTEVVESSLRRALENQEFRVRYQPQQSLRSGRLAGVEAVVRWQIPGFGYLSPEKYIETAEETGLIVDIEEYIWKLIFSHMQSWRQQGLLGVPVTLNFSPRHFAQHNVVDIFSTLLKKANLEPHVLTLRLDMSSIVQNEVSVLSTLHQLKDMGIRLVLDRIGQPYFDLFKLKTLPLHALTIDRALIWEATREAAGSVTVQWLIRLAHHLGLEAIGEGVETPQQLDFLTENGCDIVQGFVYSPPVSPNELVKNWLTPHRPLILTLPLH